MTSTSSDAYNWTMEYSERVLSGAGELEFDPDIVSEEAGKLYSELQVNHPLSLFTLLLLLFSMKSLSGQA